MNVKQVQMCIATETATGDSYEDRFAKLVFWSPCCKKYGAFAEVLTFTVSFDLSLI
jgi:hypothetical protein